MKLNLAGNRRVLGTGLVLLLGIVGAVFSRGIPAVVSRLYSTDLPTHPYFVPEHALLLYIGLPLAVLTVSIVMIAPGLLAVLALGGEDRVGPWVVKGFGAALVIHFATATCAKIFVPLPMSQTVFLLLTGGAGVVAWLGLAVRLSRPETVRWPLATPTARRRLGWMLGIVWLSVVALVPILFWQDLNADGFEALEIGGSLSWTVLPRFANQGGLMGLGIGMVPMAYPIHWFIMAFGPIEAAARLPIVLYLVGLFAALLALIEFRSPRRLGAAEEAAVIVALAVYTMVMGYSASYDPYFADLSSPAAFETLTIMLMVGTAYFLWSGSRGWFALFAVLGYLARPTGLLMVLLLGMGVALLARQRRVSTILLVGATIGLWVFLFATYELLYPSIAESALGYPASSIVDRFQYLRIDDWGRVLYVIVPGGILPALALWAIRRQDPVARSLTFATAGYFLVFYFPAFTNLHHFVPVMILPIAVLWRVVLGHKHRPWLSGVVIGTALLALVISKPRHFELNRDIRDIGRATLYRIGEYGGRDYRNHRQALASQALIDTLFAFDWNVDDPSRELVGGEQLIYYAVKDTRPTEATNYVIQLSSEPPPAGFSLIADAERGAVYVRDREAWQRERHRPRRINYRNPLYAIPRETLFYFRGIPAGNYTINLGTVPGLWRLF